MHPFLLHFKRVLVSKSYGVLYACADDLGGALLRASSLVIMHGIFEIMSKVAGLVLNTSKCVLIPLVPQSSEFFPKYSSWLAHP